MARTETLNSWQTRWTEDEKNRWTKRLINDVRPWTERKHGEVNFYLTQFFSGHGYFRGYLRRMGKVTSPSCRCCGHARDDAEHTFFVCPRWTECRQMLQMTAGDVTPDDIVTVRLQGQDRWNDVTRYVMHVLTRKKTDGYLEG